MRRPEVVIVLARADNGVIGRAGRLPWRIPADLRHFRRVTGSDPMIMGRRTFESLPRLLPGRAHIVLTRDPAWSAAGVTLVHSVEAALQAVAGPRATVIGGADVYQLFLPLADRIELTHVHAAPEGYRFVPAPDPALWAELAREELPAEAEQPAVSFVSYVRRTP